MTPTPAVEVTGLTRRFGRLTALDSVDLTIPEGSIHALLGPNGAGKSTLIAILARLLRPGSGQVRVFGRPLGALPLADRARIAYVAEGVGPPGWMRLREAERFVAPLYPTWDPALADALRTRFALDPARRIRTLSRGEGMKAALLRALAARPRLLLLDEPFAGMDVIVRDELVRGVLGSAAGEGTTILIASHEVRELEPLAERVSVLHRGRVELTADAGTLAERFRRVDAVVPEDATPPADLELPAWGPVERAGRRLGCIVDTREAADWPDPAARSAEASLSPDGTHARLAAALPAGTRIDERGATLEEVFVATVRRADASTEVVR